MRSPIKAAAVGPPGRGAGRRRRSALPLGPGRRRAARPWPPRRTLPRSPQRPGGGDNARTNRSWTPSMSPTSRVSRSARRRSLDVRPSTARPPPRSCRSRSRSATARSGLGRAEFAGLTPRGVATTHGRGWHASVARRESRYVSTIRSRGTDIGHARSLVSGHAGRGGSRIWPRWPGRVADPVTLAGAGRGSGHAGRGGSRIRSRWPGRVADLATLAGAGRGSAVHLLLNVVLLIVVGGRARRPAPDLDVPECPARPVVNLPQRSGCAIWSMTVVTASRRTSFCPGAISTP